MKNSFKLAVKNIANYGDTDVFPFPIENRIFYDKSDEVVSLLDSIHSKFEESLSRYTPVNKSALTPVGYTGFRWATLIDPIWNAYFLSLVIELGQSIESARLPADQRVVHSYRYKPNMEDGSLFDRSFGWKSFVNESLRFAETNQWVLVCDIADFYSRIYHHRLENSLVQLNDGGGVRQKIMSLLQKFSNNVSYGLPVGGPAARILSELVLNRTDKLLSFGGWKFCRFADDYHIFAKSEDEAYRALVFISEKLLINEGLSLQKMKTRIMSSKEFVSNINASDDDEEGSEDGAASFLKLSLQFDPYSPTSSEDYDILKKEVGRFDINGLLTKELHKSRIHGATTRKLLQAMKFISPELKRDAVSSMIHSLDNLAPVFGSVMLAIKEAFFDISEDAQVEVGRKLAELMTSDSYLMKIDLNILYALRVVALRRSDELEMALVQLYQSTSNEIIKRDVLLIMSKWKSSYWVSDRKGYFYSMSPWERRAFIIGSYLLGDEGRHWRGHVKTELTPLELLVRDWASKKFDGGKIGELPL